MPSLPRRFAERFALVAFGLYHLPLFLNDYPSLGGGGFSEGLAVRWGHVFTRPGLWLAHLLFGVNPSAMASAGDNGDVAEEFARLILAVGIGVLTAIVWTAADRKRPRAVWVEGALRVMLRYSIALGLASYAIAKLLPQQFPPLGAMNYETRLGELSPMRLLWNFMQYSRPYNFFGGLMETVAVVLLLFRRTATLGALVTVAVMTNVALMNIAYDVQVKLYATMILISAGVLVLYDARRLVAMFVTNRTVSPASQPTIFEGRLPNAARLAIKLLLIGSVSVSSVAAFEKNAPPPATATGANGAWGITSFMRDPAAGNAAAVPGWRRMIIDEGSIVVRLDSDALIRCRRTPTPGESTIVFSCGNGRAGELRWSMSDTHQLLLDGTYAGVKTTMIARRLDEKDYPLMRGGFHMLFDRQ
jgi:hypothetical protein